MNRKQLLERQKELKIEQADLADQIQSINTQLKMKPLTAANREWVRRASDAKRFKLRDLNQVQIELSEIRAQLRTQHQSIAEAFYRVAVDELPKEVFGRIYSAATATVHN